MNSTPRLMERNALNKLEETAELSLVGRFDFGPIAVRERVDDMTDAVPEIDERD